MLLITLHNKYDSLHPKLLIEMSIYTNLQRYQIYTQLTASTTYFCEVLF